MLDRGYKYRLGTWAECGFKKGTCQSCGHKSWVYLVDAETGEIIVEEYGKCDRIYKCGYSKRKSGNNTVYASYYYKNNNDYTMTRAKEVSKISKPSTVYPSIKQDSLEGWTTNNLVNYIWNNTKVDYDIICDKIYEYGIGTSTHSIYKNGCIYWQTDINGDVRTGKLVQYSQASGKRVKTLTPPIKWMHKILRLKNFNLQQCLFGEHLLSMNKSMPVAIVESEKSAFVMSMFWKDYIWLATGGSQNLNSRAKNVLMGRDVTVFPDIDAENEWFKITEANQWKFWSVRKMMDSVGYNYSEGDDIADVTLWKKRK